MAYGLYVKKIKKKQLSLEKILQERIVPDLFLILLILILFINKFKFQIQIL